jgi:L,D-peptidoglycan transpeptidase YkuD (ErfK/YbiS/YcfS/YnhG family)
LPVSLGRAGLAWGRGRHPAGDGPSKREGDGRAPAGIFSLDSVFGTAPADPALAMPYRQATPDLCCVDDPASRHYNRFVDALTANPDWQSAEMLQRSDGCYERAIVVAHNTTPVEAGLGSCIFIHVWAAPGVPTAGCTALALAEVNQLSTWLQRAARPVLVQLPEAEYRARQQAWGLPDFPDISAASGLER